MKPNNLNNSVTDLLDQYSVEEILFTLYAKVDEKLKSNSQDKEVLQKQLDALDTACEMLEDSDKENDFYLIY